MRRTENSIKTKMNDYNVTYMKTIMKTNNEHTSPENRKKNYKKKKLSVAALMCSIFDYNTQQHKQRTS